MVPPQRRPDRSPLRGPVDSMYAGATFLRRSRARPSHHAAVATRTYTVKGLPAGEYPVLCNYPSHEAAGKVSTLSVR